MVRIRLGLNTIDNGSGADSDSKRSANVSSASCSAPSWVVGRSMCSTSLARCCRAAALPFVWAAVARPALSESRATRLPARIRQRLPRDRRSLRAVWRCYHRTLERLKRKGKGCRPGRHLLCCPRIRVKAQALLVEKSTAACSMEDSSKRISSIR